MSSRHTAVVGAGPAGLMAAECLSGAGLAVTVYDRMPMPGRKLLMAGRGGLNLTQSEPLERFLRRYGTAAARLGPAIEAFSPEAVRAWCEGLGQATFVGSSRRVFPTALKASPLLRAWLGRLNGAGVRFALRHRWTGWDDSGALTFLDARGETVAERPEATVLALGGASWPHLGSDGGWADILRARGIEIRPLRPANCGFVVGWSDHFRERFAGEPLKPVVLEFGDTRLRGEATITAQGIEGGAIYALAAPIREMLAGGGEAVLSIDLRPDLSLAELSRRLSAPRSSQSQSTFLRKAGGLSPVAIGLLREVVGTVLSADPAQLASAIKALSLRLVAPSPLERAISTAGGIAWSEMDDTFMLRKMPGVFAIGEMVDWEAPTGGYLLQACLAMGVAAAMGAVARQVPTLPSTREPLV